MEGLAEVWGPAVVNLIRMMMWTVLCCLAFQLSRGTNDSMFQDDSLQEPMDCEGRAGS